MIYIINIINIMKKNNIETLRDALFKLDIQGVEYMLGEKKAIPNQEAFKDLITGIEKEKIRIKDMHIGGEMWRSEEQEIKNKAYTIIEKFGEYNFELNIDNCVDLTRNLFCSFGIPIVKYLLTLFDKEDLDEITIDYFSRVPNEIWQCTVYMDYKQIREIKNEKIRFIIGLSLLKYGNMKKIMKGLELDNDYLNILIIKHDDIKPKKFGQYVDLFVESNVTTNFENISEFIKLVNKQAKTSNFKSSKAKRYFFMTMARMMI